MRPIIGVTISMNEDEDVFMLNASYTSAVFNSGAIPLPLAPTTDPEVVQRYVAMVDGVLFTGGDDVDPGCFGETTAWECGIVTPLRDRFEIMLCKAVLPTGKPVFGICRGIQLMNVALGGTLYQDLSTGFPTKTLSHRQKQPTRYASHSVSIAANSKLAQIFSGDHVTVNSHHHQAIKTPAEGLIVTATSPDGVIEGVEDPTHPFFVAVQWHPERLCPHEENAIHQRLFNALADACRAQMH